MVELLGWEVNGLGAAEEVSIEDCEDQAGPPILVDGWLTTVRDGLMHIAYFVLIDTPDGQRRRIIDRHVLRQQTLKECRAGTDKAIAKALRALSS